MRVLLVGASSFVGAYEVEELLKHDKYTGGGVVATGRNPKFKDYYKSIDVPYENVDVCNPDTFKKIGRAHV